MSWSVSVTGKVAAVAAKVASDLSNIKCSEPEETIKNSVAGIVAVALAAFPAASAVRVDASGSQSKPDYMLEEFTNQLNVKIEPIWGFIE